MQLAAIFPVQASATSWLGTSAANAGAPVTEAPVQLHVVGAAADAETAPFRTVILTTAIWGAELMSAEATALADAVPLIVRTVASISASA